MVTAGARRDATRLGTDRARVRRGARSGSIPGRCEHGAHTTTRSRRRSASQCHRNTLMHTSIGRGRRLSRYTCACARQEPATLVSWRHVSPRMSGRRTSANWESHSHVRELPEGCHKSASHMPQGCQPSLIASSRRANPTPGHPRTRGFAPWCHWPKYSRSLSPRFCRPIPEASRRAAEPAPSLSAADVRGARCTGQTVPTPPISGDTTLRSTQQGAA